MPFRFSSEFLLDPAVVYLNHGSFGACPREVFEVYQRWQRELERQPAAFLGRRITQLMGEARERLAAYFGVEAGDLVYFPNPTTALNMVIRNLGAGGGLRPGLGPGDEVLATDHEYGALERTWRFVCGKVGASYVRRQVPLPVTSHRDFVEAFWSGVTPRTRVIFVSHITSPTALIFPVAEICRRARRAGILSIVDGAHAPGQIPLNLALVGADVYAGACHKWLCAPKGSAFLYARRELQPWLEPLVVSWGWEAERPGVSQFVDWHEWQGTRDLAAYLSVPAAIDFQAEHDWDAVRRVCGALARQTRRQIDELTGLEPVSPDSAEWLAQMFAARLPEVDIDALKRRLYDEYRIEVPVIRWNGQALIRVSFQAYNTPADADALVEALGVLLANDQGSV